MEILVVVLAVVLVALFGVSQYNRLRKLDIAVDEAIGQVDVQLKRRADLVPNLVETVRGYATHERETFDRVTAARGVAQSATTVTEKASADGMLTQALRGLLAVAEAYPDLKASANFLSLQEELATTENKIAFARQYYNDQVRRLNTATRTVPGSLFSGIADVSTREFYEIDDPTLREAPQVRF